MKYRWIVLGIFLLMHLFIFRNIVIATPSILTNKSVIAREELVPFFSFNDQYFSNDTTTLTNTEEIRVNYSFWTSWVRQDKILPFALIIMNTASAFILFEAFYRIGRYFVHSNRIKVAVFSAAIAAAVIHLILLYAKITHFYTLIFGFSLFALSLSFVLEQFYLLPKISYQNVAAVTLLVLFNPAIHYHVIFYAIFTILFILRIMFVYLGYEKLKRQTILRYAYYFIGVTALSLIPYLALISFLNSMSSTAVPEGIPVNYSIIYYSSIPLLSLFSMDTAGQVDLLRHGTYLVSQPRISSMMIILIIMSSFAFMRWREQARSRRYLLVTLFIATLVSMWMSLGYGSESIPTFHKILGNIALFLGSQANAMAQELSRLLSLFINILRFPHRFQFIYFYMIGLLLTIALIHLKIRYENNFKFKWIVPSIMVIAVFSPFISNSDYRTVLSSGDFDKMLAPYKVPADLLAIKAKLSTSNDGKLFILPTMESGRSISQDGNPYNFIDKFFIYYLNQPTYYNGTGANYMNKIVSYEVYRSIEEGNTDWQQILANNIGVTEILRPKHISGQSRGLTYAPNIDAAIDKALPKSNYFKRVYDGPDYALYQLVAGSSQPEPLLIDEGRGGVKNKNADTSLVPVNRPTYFPVQYKDVSKKYTHLQLMTDNPERAFYNLCASFSSKKTFRPDTSPLPFDKNLVAVSNFTSNMLSLDKLYNGKDLDNPFHTTIPPLINLPSGQFIGMKSSKTGVTIRANAPVNSSYRLAINAFTKNRYISARLDGRPVLFGSHVSDASRQKDFSYFTFDTPLNKGKHTITITGSASNPLLVESLSLIEVKDVPSNFHAVNVPDVTIVQSGPHLYDVTLKERS